MLNLFHSQGALPTCRLKIPLVAETQHDAQYFCDKSEIANVNNLLYVL